MNNHDGPSRGFWREAWQRFRRRKLAMAALVYVVLLGLISAFSPAIVGTKPVICKYKGKLYFPAMGYYNRKWENGIFLKDKFRRVYAQKLQQKDPESWAVWPLLYQDPIRRVRKNEWPDMPSNPTQSKGSPNGFNLFGTTRAGYDVFAIMVHGARTALMVGFVSMGLASLIGITLGAIAGYSGGLVDILLSRLIEIVMCIPSLVLILALMAIVERPTVWHIMGVLGLTRWTDIARLTRGEFMKLKQSDFVMAARALGASSPRIMFWHILRNALAPILVPITFGIASAILIESALSFLGFGAPPPTPSWGALLNAGRGNLAMWWLVFFPGAAIFLTVMAYNVIGEGLQEATDPRLHDGN
jgi:peptide/nickel transport system permease protein